MWLRNRMSFLRRPGPRPRTRCARSRRGPPLLAAHLGLKGEPPRRWEDILFLDTETTGLSGGTGTYVFLIGVAHFADGELILRQHLLHDVAAEREFIRHLQGEIEPFRACAS